MKRLKRILTIICFISAGLPLLVYAYSQYKVDSGVIGNGGTLISSENYQIKGTVGQPLIGRISSSSYINEGGFWYLYKQHFVPSSVDDNTLPKQFRLLGNFPNPFNPTTNIQFEIPEKCYVQLNVYSITGQRVSTLLDRLVSEGSHIVKWEPVGLSAGLYLYSLEAGNKRLMGKMLYLK